MPSKSKNKNKKKSKNYYYPKDEKNLILKQIINLKRMKARRKSTRKENGMNI